MVIPVSLVVVENFSDILFEILKALGAQGDSWFDILANLLESAVGKLLAAYSDKLSEEEARALVAVFSGFGMFKYLFGFEYATRTYRSKLQAFFNKY
ncbi:hypothetical protein SprV_0401647300 [Sparganum proliferum]